MSRSRRQSNDDGLWPASSPQVRRDGFSAQFASSFRRGGGPDRGRRARGGRPDRPAPRRDHRHGRRRGGAHGRSRRSTRRESRWATARRPGGGARVTTWSRCCSPKRVAGRARSRPRASRRASAAPNGGPTGGYERVVRSGVGRGGDRGRIRGGSPAIGDDGRGRLARLGRRVVPRARPRVRPRRRRSGRGDHGAPRRGPPCDSCSPRA